MKISEFITALESAEENFGDVELIFVDNVNRKEFFFPVNQIYYACVSDPDHDYLRVWVLLPPDSTEDSWDGFDND